MTQDDIPPMANKMKYLVLKDIKFTGYRKKRIHRPIIAETTGNPPLNIAREIIGKEK
jgi:hypothetical protein